MGGHNIGVQFERLLDIRYSFVYLPHEKLDLCKGLPTSCIERIQVNGSATQWKSCQLRARDNPTQAKA
jgi:hypothetical protein